MAYDRLLWFPLYVNDWLLSQSVDLMTFEQQGVYIRLLAMSWRDGSIPGDPEDLAALLHIDLDRFEAIWKRVSRMFAESEEEGRLVNERLEEVRAEQLEKIEKQAEKGRKSGETRRKKAEERAASEPKKTKREPKSNTTRTQVEPKSNQKEEDTEPDITSDGKPSGGGPALAAVEGGKGEKERDPSHPFSIAEDVLTAVSKAINWTAPTKAEIMRHLRPESPVQELVKLYGVEGAASMFVFAKNDWTNPPTWSSVLAQHNQLREKMAGKVKPKGSAQSLADRKAQLAAERAAKDQANEAA